jgi:hypothetical protein
LKTKRKRSDRLLVEDCLYLDTVDLRRAGVFKEMRIPGVISWDGTDLRCRFVLTSDYCGRVFLAVESPSSITSEYQLTFTRCRFGGFRLWFLCPECGRRSRKLHAVDTQLGFRCRICCDLTYWVCQKGSQRRRLERVFRNAEFMRHILST